jgi:CopG family nickel-responsive transcriptional regulator
MTKVVRFGVSLEKELSDMFDKHIREKKYPNRSEAIRDLIRQELVAKEWASGGEVAGAITMIYDHHRRDLVNRLMEIQHDFLNEIVSTQHIHVDHHNCLEIVAVKGNPAKVRQLAELLKTSKGVKHGTLSMTSTGKHLK